VPSPAVANQPPFTNPDMTKDPTREAECDLLHFLEQFENSCGTDPGVCDRHRTDARGTSNALLDGIMTMRMKSKIVSAAAAGRKRQGTAEPRWGWSGVAPLTAVQSSASDIDLFRALLPGHHSPIAQIVLALGDLGGRYHRYLHQDELGPSRAQRMAALRLLLDRLDRLLSLLNGLPGHLRLRLSKHIASDRIPIECDFGNFQAHRDDEEAVQRVAEAAADARWPVCTDRRGGPATVASLGAGAGPIGSHRGGTASSTRGGLGGRFILRCGRMLPTSAELTSALAAGSR